MKLLENLKPKTHNLKPAIFCCTTLVYFWFVAGLFRAWGSWAVITSRFQVSLVCLVLIGLWYWFFEKVLEEQRLASRLVFGGYFLAFWFLVFFISQPWLAGLLPLAFVGFLFWELHGKADASFRFNALLMVVFLLVNIDLYSLATFFAFPLWILAAGAGVLFGFVWLIIPSEATTSPTLPALLATLFLGVETFWISRFFPWSVLGMAGFFTLVFLSLAATRFLGRWSWAVAGFFAVFLGVLFLGVHWF